VCRPDGRGAPERRGDYATADPEGMGGGVLVGVFDYDDATLIVTTVTVMEAP
jgi:hypothetical protein